WHKRRRVCSLTHPAYQSRVPIMNGRTLGGPMLEPYLTVSDDGDSGAGTACAILDRVVERVSLPSTTVNGSGRARHGQETDTCASGAGRARNPIPRQWAPARSDPDNAQPWRKCTDHTAARRAAAPASDHPAYGGDPPG